MNAFSKGMRFFNSEFFGENYLVVGGKGGRGLSRLVTHRTKIKGRYDSSGRIATYLDFLRAASDFRRCRTSRPFELLVR